MFLYMGFFVCLEHIDGWYLELISKIGCHTKWEVVIWVDLDLGALAGLSLQEMQYAATQYFTNEFQFIGYCHHVDWWWCLTFFAEVAVNTLFLTFYSHISRPPHCPGSWWLGWPYRYSHLHQCHGGPCTWFRWVIPSNALCIHPELLHHGCYPRRCWI